ncbi:hypothetical protein PG1629B_0715 [Bifidobacterium pseudolongum subsp. pseudolongum]|nr:hypothetical protein PG1629B_0715 [Bifidobacterium pseudolongum subsp. pseudolongum]RYQ54343.1 hypothetical protein PG1604B_0711 [Bifidobacterium pseudolongum subsp. pseudolongum]RYQ62862.1 hypothetical protein PG1513B_0710 [Bifidobacterium pseudolongum subsp. pseudolongum]
MTQSPGGLLREDGFNVNGLTQALAWVPQGRDHGRAQTAES